jgi:hypothetical protein
MLNKHTQKMLGPFLKYLFSSQDIRQLLPQHGIISYLYGVETAIFRLEKTNETSL